MMDVEHPIGKMSEIRVEFPGLDERLDWIARGPFYEFNDLETLFEFLGIADD